MEKRCNMNTTQHTPTTFVQADTNTFRELVQKLTGATGDSQEKLPVTHQSRLVSPKPTIPFDGTGPRRSQFKLQERRHTLRKLEIKLGLTSLRHSFSTHLADSPIQSPVTPLGSESLFSTRVTGSGSQSPVSEEEKAIAEKGFYLHPSPLSTPRGSDPPELLTLFPLSSPSQRKLGSE